MERHPILGRTLRFQDKDVRIYTRTVVLWGVNLAFDPVALWEHVAVTEAVAADQATPLVRMMTTATQRRGSLPKRLHTTQTFRSVLSMDVEHRGYMPNLKISARNTVQVTGAQDMAVLGDILCFLCREYRDRGVTVTGPSPGFVGDVVLANVHFRLNFRIDRARLRDRINDERGPFLAAFEPLVRDVSVSLKHADTGPLPQEGAVHPRWFADDNRWTTVTIAEAMRLVPHINLRISGPRITSLRVFQSGSVIIVSRWPEEMLAVYQRFQETVQRLRKRVLDHEFAQQRTLTECWSSVP